MSVGARSGSCPACHGRYGVAFVARDLNRRVSDEAFTYARCDGCGLIAQIDRPADLSRFYPPGYVSVPPSLARLEQIARRTRYQIEMVRRFVSSGRLLEIGPGFGSFVWLAKTAGFEVDAIESDRAACDYLATQIGVRVTHSDSPESVLAASKTAYDAIVLWHALEHLPNPWATLQAAARVLNPGGLILVATPNPAAWQFGVLGPRWPHVDAPRHLWLIPLGALRRHLESLGLALVAATSDDPGGRSWNRFGWSQTVLNLAPRTVKATLVARAASRVAGAAVALAVSSWERAPLRGSAYTAVFSARPPAGSPPNSGTLVGF